MLNKKIFSTSIAFLYCGFLWMPSPLHSAPSEAQTSVSSPEIPSLPLYNKEYTKGNHKIKNICFKISPEISLENDDFLKTRLPFREGDPFDKIRADKAIQSLYSTQMFDQIEVVVDENPDDTVNVKFDLTSRPKIRNFIYTGQKLSKKVRKEIKVHAGDFLNESLLNDDKHTIFQHYQMRGYPKPEISYTIEKTSDPRFVDVKFNIASGESTHISKITFLNGKDIDFDPIREKMFHKPWGIFSFFTKKGNFVEDFLSIDQKTILQELRNQGYLDAKIVSTDFEKKEKGNELIYTLDLGEKYTIGDINVSGQSLYSKEKIEALLGLKKGEVFSPEKIQQAEENIRNFYGYHGYIETYADIEQIPEFQGKNVINLNIGVHESPASFINSIIIKGNYKTKNKVILRELAVAPGDKFNSVKVHNSEARLKNTGFFSKVSVSSYPSAKQHFQDIVVDVEEQNTGKFAVGVKANAKNSQTLFAEIAQSNFDWGSKTHYAGGGQKARLKAELGTRESGALLSFEDPWLFDRELTFGVDIFGNQSKYRKKDDNYSGPSFNHLELGIEPYFSKRLYGLWVGRVAYNLTKKRIFDVSEHAIEPLQKEKGWSTSSRIKFSIERDARNNFIFPTAGSFIGFSAQLAGGPFGGSVKVFKFGVDWSQYFTISSKYEHILALGAKIGIISPFSHTATPYSERAFLGGGSLMRGFEERGISPREVKEVTINSQQKTVYGDPLGGNSYSYFCAEYTARVFERVYLAGFVELGCVNKSPSDIFENYNCDVGFGLRIFAMNMPLRLDWGYPVHRSKFTEKKGVQFNFSVGTSF